jgi:hypothetical protein
MTGGLPDGVSKETAHEIKALSSIFNANYAEDISKKELNEGQQVFFRVYKNAVYITIPFKKQFFIYPSYVDIETLFVIGRSTIGSLEDSADSILFIKDKNAVYQFNKDFTLTKIDTLDPKTFNLVGASEGTTMIIYGYDNDNAVMVFKDKNHVYYFANDNLYTSAYEIDTASFQIHDMDWYTYFTDKNYVYFIDEKETDALDLLKVVPNSDSSTYETIGNRGFAKDKNQVYFDYQVIEGADPKIFEIVKAIDGEIIRDEHSLFIFDEKLDNFKKAPNFDLQTVEQVEVGIFPSNIFKNDEAVYSYDVLNYTLIKMQGADPKSFYSTQYIDGTILFQDKNAFYVLKPENYALIKIDGDKDTFKILVGKDHFVLAKDKYNIYYIDKTDVDILSGVDIETFEIVADTRDVIAKDEKAVYSLSNGAFQQIPGIDVKTFEVIQDLNSFLARDINHIYTKDPTTYELVQFEEMDADTFEVVSYVEGSGAYPVVKDKDAVFVFTGDQFEKVIDADALTFSSTVIPEQSGYYFKDKNYTWVYKWAYNGGSIVKFTGTKQFE